ncbi:uncharacterized protein LOC108337872 isoform X1 [Vigna angularis]|uniref:uncharacterized protein LOC108337872 isoform X1 n=1 Tax=Phaseolus angularis TaxID=3914 RepID=UPI0022B58946|nr:uncharacterized protein LOC108337872 isoform X1 [Vigna angularis]
MEAIQSWVSNHKLATLGGLWASGIGASLVANSRTRSPMKPSLRLIHARYMTCPIYIHTCTFITYIHNIVFLCFFFSHFFYAVWICRMHAQALTLAVLSGAAVYRYYEIRECGPKQQAHYPSPTVAQLVEWELQSPF